MLSSSEHALHWDVHVQFFTVYCVCSACSRSNKRRASPTRQSGGRWTMLQAEIEEVSQRVGGDDAPQSA
eukprot:s744_g7.t1